MAKLIIYDIFIEFICKWNSLNFLLTKSFPFVLFFSIIRLKPQKMVTNNFINLGQVHKHTPWKSDN